MGRVNEIFKRIVGFKPRGFWPGFIVGLIYFSWIFWWFWSIYPLVLLGLGNKIFSFLIILVPFAITVLGASMFWGVFSYGFIFLKNPRPVLLPLFASAAFVTIEYLRTWFIGILWFSRNSLLGAHWTLGNPAYLLADLGPIRQSASWWGIYGVDFLIIFLAVAVFSLIRAKNKSSKIILSFEITAMVMLLISASLATPKKNPPFEDKLITSIIQTKNPTKFLYEPGELLTDFIEKDKLLKEASKKSDIIIFPETTDFSKSLSGFLDTHSVQKYFSGLAPKNILIIDHDRVPEQEGLKSKVLLIDSENGIVGSYDKRLLTPGGEYLPYILEQPFLLLERFFKNNFISSGAVFTPGTESGALSYKNRKIKLLVCSDIISPDISREDNFSFMVGLDNMAIFRGNKLIEWELLSAAQFRAAENRKYLVLASNYGRSYIIDQLGKVIKSTPSSGYGILTGDIIPNISQTWYNKLGDRPILLLSIIIVLAWLIFAFIHVNKN